MLATMNAATKLAGISILILGSAAVAKLAGAKDIDTPSESANEAESSGNEPGTSDPPPVATSPFASTVIRAGVDANALAAAGVAAEGVASVVAACEAAHDQSPTALSDADGSLASCRSQIGALRRLVRSGRGSPEDVQSLQALVAQEQQAEADRAAALDALFTGATAGLTQAQRATLEAIRRNRHWRMPVEYLVVDRSEADWVKLRTYLGEERTAPEMGDEPRAACVSFLAAVRADPAVSAAIANLDAHRAGVEAAWNLALSD